MTNKVLILSSAAVLALAACGQSNNNADTNMTDVNMTGMTDTNMAADNGAYGNAAAPAAVPTTAQGFVNAAAASDKFEIESSKLAAGSAQSAAVKAFAAKMISAHTASTAKLKSTVAGMNPPLTIDDTLSADQQQKLDALKAAHGADFDTAYKTAQVDAHQAALDALNGYAASGDNAQLKTLAKGMVPTVTAHLNMAKGLK
jgi:putative membrane protein